MSETASPTVSVFRPGWRRAVVLSLCFASSVSSFAAQESNDLDTKQEALSSRYARFEKLLLQMSEYLGRTDPDRAELLMRALSRSREDRISTRMNSIVELLKAEDFDENFMEVLEGQDQLIGDLRSILELLQSEDRRSELEEETARIKAMLKDVNKLIGDQKIARANASRAAKPSEAIKSQQRVADKTRKVVDRVKQADAKKDGKKLTAKSEENPNGTPEGKTPSITEPPSGDPQDGQQQSGQPQQGEPQESGQKKPDKKSPGRAELEKAQKAMQEAIEQLRKEQKEGSSEQQDQALQNLMAAKEKLEEKLKQLREEERELMLAKLEARFQKMLAMQTVINSGTATLGEKPRDKWLEGDDLRARQLAQLENEVGIEASKTLAVLKEEGTSVSFPLAVEDVREDILVVARRLENSDAGELTQEIEADIVEAIQEMVLALQKEMEKGDDKKGQQQQQSSPQDAQGDPVLVELLAELKMLRTLQKRINRRTRQIGREIDGDQTQNADLLEQLDRLADRQERVRRTAIDIARTRKEK